VLNKWSEPRYERHGVLCKAGRLSPYFCDTPSIRRGPNGSFSSPLDRICSAHDLPVSAPR